jgi:hypothetical protein
MKGTLLAFLLSIVILAFLPSCQNNSKSVSVNSSADSLNAKGTDTGHDTMNIILPSPLQIGSIFKHAGLSYLPGLTNSLKETSQYNSIYSQAINMGVYGADISYCVLNKQTQEALDYLKTLHSLADKLGFGTIFESSSLTKRFQNNLNSEDSLTDIIADLQMDVDTYLANNNQKYVSVVAFAGAWIESMYIGSKVYSTKKSPNVSIRISEQMTILDNIVKALTKYKNQDTHITDVIASLKGIETNYMGYDEVKKNISEDTTQLAKLTDEHIGELSKAIEQLREKFIMS